MCRKMENFVVELCGLAAEAKRLGLESDYYFDAILSASYQTMPERTATVECFNDGSVVNFDDARAQLR
ncbi:hypothetical protein N9K16_06080 [Alphaproteobacteria bacterium]|jgi:hypothetical protein|nr:hypothetical protein [Alphaproteobacteria bacterium]